MLAPLPKLSCTQQLQWAKRPTTHSDAPDRPPSLAIQRSETVQNMAQCSAHCADTSVTASFTAQDTCRVHTPPAPPGGEPERWRLVQLHPGGRIEVCARDPFRSAHAARSQVDRKEGGKPASMVGKLGVWRVARGARVRSSAGPSVVRPREGQGFPSHHTATTREIWHHVDGGSDCVCSHLVMDRELSRLARCRGIESNLCLLPQCSIAATSTHQRQQSQQEVLTLLSSRPRGPKRPRHHPSSGDWC